MEKAQRRPAIEKAISELNENDFRVRVLGTVVSLDDENSLCVIDDGTAKVVAFFENGKQIESMEPGKLARIIGKVRKNNDNGNETELDVEIVQDMSEFDLELMKITNDVLEKLR